MSCDYKELMENRPANQAADVDELRESTRIIKGVVDEEDDHLLHVLEGEDDGWIDQ